MDQSRQKLSHLLLDLGFFCALGTTEHPGMGRGRIVGRGIPNTIDYNNGVHVVFDESGRPWILRHDPTGDTEGALMEYGLERGAYVPHSNDGGRFVIEVLPNL